MQTVEQAVILVGGMGTRLKSMGFDCPKPIVDIAGRPFIDHLIRYFSRFNIKKILLIAGYKGELIYELYHNKTICNIEISVTVEPNPMGTGGALKFASNYIDNLFLFSNGDSLFDIDLTPFLSKKILHNCSGRILLRKVKDASRYGTVELSKNGIINSFFEKKAQSRNQLINAGIGIFFKEEVLKAISSLPCSLESDIFPQWSSKGLLEGQLGDGYFIDIGIPESYQEANDNLIKAITKPAAFLDRDGVINIDNGYTFKCEDLIFTKTAIDAIKLLNNNGYYVIVVSNQSGVARGFYNENDVQKFHHYMNQILMLNGAHIDAFYYSPYHPDGDIADYKKEHNDRKPNAGMLARACNDWPIKKQKSFLVGDKDSDIEAANKFGIKSVLVEPNHCDLLYSVTQLDNEMLG